MPIAVVHLGGAVVRRPREVCSPPHDLDQRQQVHRVERVADDQRSGWVMPCCISVGSRPEVRRAEHDVGPGGGAGPAQQVLLQLESLGRALLHEVDAGGRFLRRGDERQRALGRELRG